MNSVLLGLGMKCISGGGGFGGGICNSVFSSCFLRASLAAACFCCCVLLSSFLLSRTAFSTLAGCTPWLACTWASSLESIPAAASSEAFRELAIELLLLELAAKLLEVSLLTEFCLLKTLLSLLA